MGPVPPILGSTDIERTLAMNKRAYEYLAEDQLAIQKTTDRHTGVSTYVRKYDEDYVGRRSLRMDGLPESMWWRGETYAGGAGSAWAPIR